MRRTNLALIGLLFLGCAPVIPKELVNARSAYNAMQRGATDSTTDAAPSRRARESLARAEQSYADNGPTQETRDLATAAERDAVDAQVACLKRGGVAEVAAVDDGAAERLRAVLTAVPGTVMFEFDKSDLLPAAKVRLDQLARALAAVKKTDRPQMITIAGYADGKGDEAYNKALSERRAIAVRDYLTAHGYDANLVEVRAMGESRPFTSDATAEGRANNRRVEIFLGQKKHDE